MAIYTTACPRNCYSTCAVKAHVENGRLRRLEPHPDNRATAGGPCLKGLAYVERVVAKDRITTPLARRGGGFVPISWNEALDTIAECLQALRDEPQSVLYYAASGTKGLLNGVGKDFWRLYGGCTTTYGDLCWPAGLEATRLTLGDNKHNAPWDLENARLIVLWGKNSAETNIHQMTFVDRALAQGAELVVIDPRRTQTAERADLLIRPRPGSDGALALAVARRLIERGQLDEAFLDAHVHGFAEYRDMALEVSVTELAEICDVLVTEIDELAEKLGTIRPATICAGYGMQRYTNSGQAMRAILALLVLTGNLGKPGAGWQFANLQSAVWDDEKTKDPFGFYPPPKDEEDEIRISISTARLGREMLETRDPALRMAWVERGNPLTQNPETETVREAFRALEFRVVVEQFMTDTAREADIVLPAKTFFEQSDVIGAYWHPYLQLKQKVIEPPGEVKPESEIYRLLAERLGLPREKVDEKIPGSSDAEIDAWLEAKLHEVGVDLESLRQGPVLAPGHQEIAFSDFAFKTPSGKIELYSEEARTRWQADPLPRYRESEESQRGTSKTYPLYFMTPNTKNRIHSQFNNLPMIRRLSDKPRAQIHPEDARERDIADGDRIRIWNDRGGFCVEARYDYGIRRGAVAVTNGWWASDGASVNVCSLGRETDMGHGAAFHDNLVEMEKSP